MKLDTYHQVLLKLHEITGGSENKVINLVDLIKKEGFGGAVDDICEFMSKEGWVAQSDEETFRITTWGVEEVQRTKDASQPDKQATLQSAASEARKAVANAREFANLFEEYSQCLLKAELKEKAKKLHLSAMNKLKAVKEAVEASDKWAQKK